MTDEQKQAALAHINQAQQIRDLTRSVYMAGSGPDVLAMHMLESTLLNTDPEKINPVLAANFVTILYNLGIFREDNVSQIVRALLTAANDDDLAAEKAALSAKEDT